MVNFAKEQTIGTAPEELLKTIVLQKRDTVTRQFEKYYRYKFAKAKPPTHELRSKLLEFFLEVGSMYNNSEKKSYAAYRKKILDPTTKPDDLMIIFETLCKFLYDKRIIKLDTRTRHDPAKIEDENKDLDI